MKKILFLFILFLISGCYTPVGMWFTSNFSIGCPNKYEKTIIRNSCNAESVKLKLEDHVWSGYEQELPDRLLLLKKKVMEERLYINNIYIGKWHGDIRIVVLASDIPTSLHDKDELAEHKYRKIREEKCNCRLCK